LVNLALWHSLPVQLYWHCWSLESDVLDSLTAALVASAKQQLQR
jgi:LysR family transcriptional regulator, chromosome initiation inhibitor